MARVYYDPDSGNWVHADTGNKINGWAVRNQEPHKSAIEARAGASTVNTKWGNAERVSGDYTLPGTVDDGPTAGAPIPPENFTAAEEQYVEELLRDANYA